MLESDAPSTSRIVLSFTHDRGSETNVSRALLYKAENPSELRANYATPYEQVKLSLLQVRDSNLRHSVCNNGEVKLEPHSLLPLARYATTTRKTQNN